MVNNIQIQFSQLFNSLDVGLCNFARKNLLIPKINNQFVKVYKVCFSNVEQKLLSIFCLAFFIH